MRAASRVRWVAPACLLALLAVPSSAAPAKAHATLEPVVEAIVFDGVSMGEHATILERISVRVGDRLTVAARQRIGRELRELSDPIQLSYQSSGFVFSTRPGLKPGAVSLIIRAGC